MNYYAVEPGIQTFDMLEKLGVRIFKGLLFDVHKDIPDNYFDFILMSHALEHFNSLDLDSVLRLLFTKLRSHGVIVIEVPYSEVPRQHNDYENEFMPDPTHLSFFSPESLKILFQNNNYDILFLGCAGMDYHDNLIYAANINANELLKRDSIIKNIRGYVVSRMPKQIKSLLHLIKAIRNKKDLYTILKSPQFNYSDNGTVIRLVAKKSESMS